MRNSPSERGKSSGIHARARPSGEALTIARLDSGPAIATFLDIAAEADP